MKSSAAKVSAAKTSGKSVGKKSGPSRRAAVVARQSQPTPDRYKEIQQALAGKGYFSGEPDGKWGQTSVDALKKFQHDQNLTEDGKIGSLSLIALGLGPKRDTSLSSQKSAESAEKSP